MCLELYVTLLSVQINSLRISRRQSPFLSHDNIQQRTFAIREFTAYTINP
jgi:hypothetical protein